MTRKQFEHVRIGDELILGKATKHSGSIGEVIGKSNSVANLQIVGTDIKVLYNYAHLRSPYYATRR